jgi:hypothetical protein
MGLCGLVGAGGLDVFADPVGIDEPKVDTWAARAMSAKVIGVSVCLISSTAAKTRERFW